MKFNAFQWDQNNVAHIARHNILPEEAEEACFNNPLILKGRRGRYYFLGQTDSGRYLKVVIQPKWRGLARVITARDMTQSERRLYFKR